MAKIIMLSLMGLIGTSFNFQERLEKTKVADGISMLVPENFYLMTPEDIAQRYPSVRSPIAAYTDRSRLVNLSVNISATQWRPQDIEIARDFFKASLFNLYDRVNIIQEGIRKINKKQFIVFEFESRIEGDRFSLDKKDPIRTYTWIQYLIINGKTIVFSFNCPLRFKGEWQDSVSEIMNSIKVKNNI